MQKYQDFEVEKVKLDIKDKKILKLLNKNCRITLVEISNKTGIPIDSVKYRIKRMEKNEVFSYAVILNPLKIGYPIFNTLFLQLVNFDKEQEKKLMNYVQNHPYLAYAAKIAGKYDFAISVVAKNLTQFTKIVGDFKTEFNQIVKEVDMAMVLEEYKYDYLIDLIED
ncbi:hypothetical protein AUJ61_02725 [Candidatus Pacearchaeota archaeon CG1_02_30_18]|nr:MAG: hypothetical protein AUJ61_02725 [Candidatus Pacearchaeota archaeon CG1_02_30_18]PIN71278.1 MAG: hypothetical protein COV77_02940 [Candidatus Pacearchaeota archaeon CG11_big_fil_rev_8_21_14_0_20_30_13]PIZ81959.1 MAG: hypothetical protein COX98_01645 [Candidatus Pacearchaeota archaeon CG_4_10_14_0_2_um_filter_30_11]PJA71574.1 MAG: hypothetical protein CO153_00795 [Candidatus Pacearchaeota archaeon CG_4_9_14_3_um_filter_30_11]